MNIRFVSSLTAEDENLCAPALLRAVGALLDQFPIAYTVRIETSGAQVYQHSHGGAPDPSITHAAAEDAGKGSASGKAVRPTVSLLEVPRRAFVVPPPPTNSTRS